LAIWDKNTKIISSTWNCNFLCTFSRWEHRV